MGLDSLSPVAPARVRCLLLPYGNITRSRFIGFVERLQENTTVRLGDASPNDGPERNMFSPLAFPNGIVVYDMRTSDTLPAHRSLVPFELYRETLVVLAIADGREYSNGTEAESNSRGSSVAEISQLADCIPYLKDNHQTALVHQLLLFDYVSTISDKSPGLLIVPPQECPNSTTLKTIMCDVTSNLLSELTPFAKSVQALPNIETPKASSTGRSDSDSSRGVSRGSPRALNTPGSRTASPASDLDKQSHRASLPAHLSASLASDSRGNGNGPKSTTDPSVKPAATFDDMNGLSDRPATLASSDKTNPGNKDRVSMHGFGSGSLGERARNQAQSRIRIVTGSIYLLAGHWPDAVKSLTDGATVAKASNDYSWYAKALDYLLITLVMYAWAGLDFDIPSICYPFGDKSTLATTKPSKIPTSSESELEKSKSSPEGIRSVSLQNLCNLLPDLANNVLHLYSRGAQFNSDQVPQIVYSETTIRLAKLLSFAQASFGVLGDDGLGAIVLSHEFKRHRKPPEQPRIAFLNRTDIAHFVYRAIPVPTPELSVEVTDRLRIMAGIASVLAFLGFHRKKGFVLRELAIMLLPALVQSRKDSAAELGVHPAASLSALDLTGGEGEVGVSSQDEMSDTGIQDFLALLCDVYGVVLSAAGKAKQPRPEQSSASDRDDYEDVSTITKRALKNASKRFFGNPILKMDVLRSCINICEALPDLGGILRFSSDLMRTAGSGIAPGPETTDGYPSLPIEDQVRLTNNITRTVSAARQLGLQNVEAEYWDEFLVRDINILGNGSSNVPLSRRRADLDLATTNTTSEKKGPFIFNPFSAKPATKLQENLLVANEEATFVLLLQNLYDVDLEIEWIKFDVSDLHIDAIVRGVVVGPYRTQKVHFPSIPRSTDRLQLSGCIAKIKGCRARRFPLFGPPWRMKEEVKIKQIGLSAAALPEDRPVSVSSDPAQATPATNTMAPKTSVFEANVIDAQPTLLLKSTSLHQSAAMLLEGETQKFTITVENISDTPTDLFLVSFQDSTSDLLQSALGKNDIPAMELYEAEFSMLRRPALRIALKSDGGDLTVAPHDDLTFEVEIFGKIGLTYGSALIEYGFLGSPRSEGSDRVFTRQLSVQFSVTVSPCVELTYNDFLPFSKGFTLSDREIPLSSSNSSLAFTKATDEGSANDLQVLFKRFGLEGRENDYCLVIMDLHNAWPSAISVLFQISGDVARSEPLSDSHNNAVTLSEMVQPNKTSRILLWLPKFSVQDPHAPIPSLNPKNKRQFVLSASKISPDIERLTREMFWYREEVLKRVQATWSIPASKRHGAIDLRRLTVNLRTLEALRLDDLTISMSLSICDSPTASSSSSSTAPPSNTSKHKMQQDSQTHFTIPPSTFLDLKATVTSRLPHPIYPLIRLQPALRTQPYNIALDLGRKLAFNGVLQRGLARLAPGESRTVTLGMTFLAAGDYEIGACVEEIRPWRPGGADEKKAGGDEHAGGTRQARARAETGDFGLLGPERTRRRAWYARDACMVDVRGTKEEEEEEEEEEELLAGEE